MAAAVDPGCTPEARTAGLWPERGVRATVASSRGAQEPAAGGERHRQLLPADLCRLVPDREPDRRRAHLSRLDAALHRRRAPRDRRPRGLARLPPAAWIAVRRVARAGALRH